MPSNLAEVSCAAYARQAEPLLQTVLLICERDSVFRASLEFCVPVRASDELQPTLSVRNGSCF